MEGLLGGNDFFQGGLALMLMGAVIAAIRYAPGAIWHLVQRFWSVSITTRDQELVRWICGWIAQTEYGKNCQWLDATSSNEAGGLDAFLRPGFGHHAFRESGTRYWVEHVLEDHGVAGKISALTLRTLGRDLGPLRFVIKLAVKLAKAEQFGRNVVYINDRWGSWESIRLFPTRAIESLFLKDGLIENILSDAVEFFEGAEWYRVRGLPHRRGHLFWGPPGNGKSTIIQVLATELGMPIHLLSLSEPEMTDYSLARAIGNTPEKCLLVIEDFEKLDLDTTDMTVAGLLNAIDGPLASEGRLLIFTANDISPIEDYFLRPGRIDRKWPIWEPQEPAIKSCMTAFSVDGTIDTQAFLEEALTGKWSMAQVQQELIIQMER